MSTTEHTKQTLKKTLVYSWELRQESKALSYSTLAGDVHMGQLKNVAYYAYVQMAWKLWEYWSGDDK